jgi:ubiquinone/menaquinone biosynthesis C-methylase UbiE
MSTKHLYNHIADDYARHCKDPNKRKSFATKFIKKNLPQLNGKKILDFGCGTGADTVLYQKTCDDVYGIDISKKMVEMAKQISPKPQNISLASIESTNFKNNFFDIVVGCFALHYLNNFLKAYKEISRILRPNGIFIHASHHPLRDLSYQKNNIYGNQELVTINLHDKVPIKFPTHTLSDYFSKTFFDNFYIDNFEEELSPTEYLDDQKTPGILCVKAIKR